MCPLIVKLLKCYNYIHVLNLRNIDGKCDSIFFEIDCVLFYINYYEHAYSGYTPRHGKCCLMHSLGTQTREITALAQSVSSAVAVGSC